MHALVPFLAIGKLRGHCHVWPQRLFGLDFSSTFRSDNMGKHHDWMCQHDTRILSHLWLVASDLSKKTHSGGR